MCVVFYSSFVCISAYASVYFKTTLQECLRAGLPPGFPSTVPRPVRVSAVLSTLAVWIRNQTKKEMSDIKKFRKNGVPRLPVALGSSPELSAFTMSLALPVFRDFFLVWYPHS